MNVDAECDKCGKSLSLLVEDFERSQETGMPVLCGDCLDEYMKFNKEPDPPKRCFEYLVEKPSYERMLELGDDQWEAVCLLETKALLFKREYFREA